MVENFLTTFLDTDEIKYKYFMMQLDDNTTVQGA